MYASIPEISGMQASAFSGRPHLFAQPVLGANAKAVAHDQHTDHQLWIDRGTPRVAIERCQAPPQIVSVKEAVDPAQQVVEPSSEQPASLRYGIVSMTLHT
jgi:hypothetical protein